MDILIIIVIIVFIISIISIIYSCLRIEKAKKITAQKYKEEEKKVNQLKLKYQKDKNSYNQEIKNNELYLQELKSMVFTTSSQLSFLKKSINQSTNFNNQQKKQAENLNNLILDKKNTIDKINNEIIQKKRLSDQFQTKEKEKIKNNLEDFKKITSQAADIYVDNLQKYYQDADAAHAQKMTRLKEEQDSAAADLNKMKEMRKAVQEALLKQQEIKQNKDNYRLLPCYQDLNDIKLLQEVKKSLSHPRVLSMLIWQTYWQPIAKKQFPVILQDKTKMGIYKITNLKTNECYIGQSVDIYKRWSQHCKAGLGIDTPPGNKLYQAIKTCGLQNFTFELLCQCSKDQLDEKERYFIELYQADTYGYNGTKGNK